jgi:putative DNA primase/helicase
VHAQNKIHDGDSPGKRPTVTDLLSLAGLAELGENPSPDVLVGSFRKLGGLINDHALDALEREAVRASAIDVLRRAKVAGPARWVDAALPSAPSTGAGNDLAGRAVAFNDVEPWPEAVDGAALLEETQATFNRFLALPDGAAEALALWVLFAHAHDAFGVSPILALTSPEKRCGKTTTLSIVGALVPRPLSAANVTAATIYRAVEQYGPTLLIDEADTFLDDAEGLRGILNSGHVRTSANVIRLVGDGHEARIFSTWAPKAIAKIKDLPGTLADRAVAIPLRRRAPGEVVERVRLDRLRDELASVRRRLARWAGDHLEALREADPDVPVELHDRAADNWRPLLAVADHAGGDWPALARRAARLLSGADATEDDSAGVLILADLHALFSERGADRLASAEIVEALGGMEDRPWPEWKAGKPITVRQLARLLERFKIKPKKIRVGEGPLQGYELATFSDAFARYLSTTGGTGPEQPEHWLNGATNDASVIRNGAVAVPVRKSAGNQHGYRDVPDVPDRAPQTWDAGVPDLFDAFAGVDDGDS